MTGDSDLRKIIKPITFMKITQMLGNLSYDEKHQVGSILVKNNFKSIHAIGYNGNFEGGENKRDSMEHGESGYLHAEENVIIKSSLTEEDVRDNYTLYVTMTPCEMCAKRLIGKGVTRVLYLNDYINCGDSKSIFRKVDVYYEKFDSFIINKLKLYYYGKDKEDFNKEYDYEFINSKVKEYMPKYFETNKNLLPDNFLDYIRDEYYDGRTSYDNICKIIYHLLYKFISVDSEIFGKM